MLDGKFLQNFFRFETVQHHALVPRGVAANQFHPAARAIELFREQFHERLVGRRVHRRGRDLDSQFIAERLADFVAGSARLELYGQQSAAGGFTEKSRGRHNG